MRRSKDRVPLATYYRALQDIFSKQSGILTAALPHLGERGRNDEVRLREFLGKILPGRFSIGTGIIVCSKASIPDSSQTDIVIYDEKDNSPLHRELSAYVYPIEVVYGTIEVKGALTHKDIGATLQSIAKVRRLAKHKWYVKFEAKPKNKGTVVAPRDLPSTLSPRSYLFAYDTSSWTSLSSFKAYLKRNLERNPKSHLHGVVVLDKNWFLYQEAFEDEVVLRAFSDDALMRFMHKLTYDISSIRMHPVSLDKYFGISYGDS